MQQDRRQTKILRKMDGLFISNYLINHTQFTLI